MLGPRRARKLREPLGTRMSTFLSWIIRVQAFFVFVIEASIFVPLGRMCYCFAPRFIREPHESRQNSFWDCFPNDSVNQECNVMNRIVSTTDASSIAKQRLLNKMRSQIFPKERLIREPHKSRSDFFWRCFPDGIDCVGHHVPKMTFEKKRRTAWITYACSTAIMFCPYILQRLLKHIRSHIFPKLRMNPAETIAAFGSTSSGRARFILDSGASSHFVGDAGMLQDIIYFPHDRRHYVSLADGFCLPIVGIGTLLFNGLSECGTYTRSYRIPNVRYVSGLAMNVISVSQLDKEHGLCSAFHGGKCEIVEAGGIVIGEAALVDRLYEVIYLHVPRGPEV